MAKGDYIDQDKLIKVTDADVKTADIEFIRAFEEDFRKLAELLGLFAPIRRAPNTTLTYYEVSGTLEEGAGIGEGELVPVSKYQHSKEHIASLDWKKWRKQTSMEAISKDGFDMAVTATDNGMIKDIQKGIRKDLFDFLKTGTGKITMGGSAEVSGKTLQETLANIWAQMNIDFESTNASPLYFINPVDIAKYLGTATITNTGTVAFGMTYLENFLGMFPTIVTTDVPAGQVITTPRENLHLYFADAATAGFNYTTFGQTGYVGVFHEPDYNYNVYQTHVVSAIKPFCDYLDKIYQSTIAYSA